MTTGHMKKRGRSLEQNKQCSLASKQCIYDLIIMCTFCYAISTPCVAGPLDRAKVHRDECGRPRGNYEGRCHCQEVIQRIKQNAIGQVAMRKDDVAKTRIRHNPNLKDDGSVTLRLCRPVQPAQYERSRGHSPCIQRQKTKI